MRVSHLSFLFLHLLKLLILYVFIIKVCFVKTASVWSQRCYYSCSAFGLRSDLLSKSFDFTAEISDIATYGQV